MSVSLRVATRLATRPSTGSAGTVKVKPRAIKVQCPNVLLRGNPTAVQSVLGYPDLFAFHCNLGWQTIPAMSAQT